MAILRAVEVFVWLFQKQNFRVVVAPHFFSYPSCSHLIVPHFLDLVHSVLVQFQV